MFTVPQFEVTCEGLTVLCYLMIILEKKKADKEKETPTN